MTSPSYQQRVSRNDDHAAINDKVHRARVKLAELEQNCAANEGQIRAAQTRFDSLADHDRGWILEIVIALAVISIVLEWFPAHMMSLVFFTASAVELTFLTAAFAGGGFLLGLVLGEMARRYRMPQRHTLIDQLCFVLAALAVVAFLGIGFELRMGYAATSTDANTPAAVGPAILAAALTTLAFIGIVIAFTAGYHRESFETLGLRYRIRNLHDRLKVSEAQLQATQRELGAAERASVVAADGGARVQTVTSDGSYTNGSSNGVSPPPGNGVVH
jgi:hypothetical protein